MNPTVTLESISKNEKPMGKIDAIHSSPIQLQSFSKQPVRKLSLSPVRTDQQSQRVVLSGLGKVEMVGEGLMAKEVANLPFGQQQELTYQALFDGQSGTMTIEGSGKALIVVINPSGSSKHVAFSTTTLPLESLDLSWQDPKTGARKTHPKFQGAVRYRDLPDFPEVKFQAPMFLTVDKLERFETTFIRLDLKNQTFLVKMQGTAGYLKTGTAENPQDLRPTVFDVIRFHPVLAPLRNLIGL